MEPNAEAPDCDAPESRPDASRVKVLRRCSIGRRRGASSVADDERVREAERVRAAEREVVGAIMFVTSSSIIFTSMAPSEAVDLFLASSCQWKKSQKLNERKLGRAATRDNEKCSLPRDACV